MNATYYGFYKNDTGSCGRLDIDAVPDEDYLLERGVWDAGREELILEKTLIAASSIKKNQRQLLKALVKHGNGAWKKGDLWYWEYPYNTDKLLKSLMQYGIVGWSQRDVPAYELTPYGWDFYKGEVI